MVLLAFHPRVPSRILSCRAPPRVCGDGHQNFCFGTPQRSSIPPWLPVSRLRFLWCCLHYWIVVGMGGRGLAALLTRALVTSEQDGGAPTDVPVARGTETRSRRRRLRIKGRDTQSFAVSCKALVETYVRRKPVFTPGFLMQKHWLK